MTDFVYEVIIDYEDENLIGYDWYFCQGYLRRERMKFDGPGTRIIHLHRVILERKLGRTLAKGEIPDHINRCKWDNRRENLRAVTPSENQRNRIFPTNMSGFKGVSKRRNRWIARIRNDNRMQIQSKLYETPEEAYDWYLQAASLWSIT